MYGESDVVDKLSSAFSEQCVTLGFEQSAQAYFTAALSKLYSEAPQSEIEKLYQNAFVLGAKPAGFTGTALELSFQFKNISKANPLPPFQAWVNIDALRESFGLIGPEKNATFSYGGEGNCTYWPGITYIYSGVISSISKEIPQELAPDEPFKTAIQLNFAFLIALASLSAVFVMFLPLAEAAVLSTIVVAPLLLAIYETYFKEPEVPKVIAKNETPKVGDTVNLQEAFQNYLERLSGLELEDNFKIVLQQIGHGALCADPRLATWQRNLSGQIGSAMGFKHAYQEYIQDCEHIPYLIDFMLKDPVETFNYSTAGDIIRSLKRFDLLTPENLEKLKPFAMNDIRNAFTTLVQYTINQSILNTLTSDSPESIWQRASRIHTVLSALPSFADWPEPIKDTVFRQITELEGNDEFERFIIILTALDEKQWLHDEDDISASVEQAIALVLTEQDIEDIVVMIGSASNLDAFLHEASSTSNDTFRWAAA